MHKRVEGGYAKAVLNGYTMHPSRPVAERIIDGPLSQHRVLLWGGAVRDGLINHIHQMQRSPRDLDLLVDDRLNPLDYAALARELDGTRTFFGGVRCGSVDVISLTTLVQGTEPWEETVLHTDLDVVSAGYDLQEGFVLDGGAIAAIRNRTVDLINDHDRDRPSILISRVVKTALRLEYRIGPRARTVMAQIYTQESRSDILNHYRSKGWTLGDRIVEVVEKELAILPQPSVRTARS